jgi:hypothetical protein
LPELPSS